MAHNMQKGRKQLMQPNLWIDKYTDITPTLLKELGAKAVLVDIDNTVVEHRSNEVNQVLIDWFDALKEAGLAVCILSNNPKSRVKAFSKKLLVPFVAGFSKPWPWGFGKAIKKVGTSRENIVMIGDQVFTDLVGSNWAKIKCILVKPIGGKELPHTRLLRKLEDLVTGGRK